MLAASGSWDAILAALRLPSYARSSFGIAASGFKLVKSNNGRKDYIKTLDRWDEANHSLWTPRKILRLLPLLAKLAVRFLTNRNFRIQLDSIFQNDQQQCFIDEIMTHERMFFEKIA